MDEADSSGRAHASNAHPGEAVLEARRAREAFFEMHVVGMKGHAHPCTAQPFDEHHEDAELITLMAKELAVTAEMLRESTEVLTQASTAQNAVSPPNRILPLSKSY